MSSAGAVMAVLVVLALAYWLWGGATQRSITDAEGNSILAAQGILEHGYPRLPSGFIYYRAFVPNYLMAGSIQLFGLNDLATGLPSLLMALGTLWLVYRFASDVLGRPWVGVAAAALLVALQVEAYYATSGRMYMALQFFSLLAIYSAWRGYIKGETRFQLLAFLGVVGAVLSHGQGGALLVVIPGAVAVVWWLRGTARPGTEVVLGAVIFLILLGLFIYYSFIFSFPQGIPQLASHGGVDPDHTGLNLNGVGWLKHVFNLESALPLGLLSAPLLPVLGFQALQSRHSLAGQGVLYSLLLFAGVSIATLLVIKTTDVRFWMILIPLYVLLVCRSALLLAESLNELRKKLPNSGLDNHTVAVTSFIVWGITIFLVSYFAYSPTGSLALLRGGYGLPCSGTEKCAVTIKEQYAGLRSTVTEEDVVVSSNPKVTGFYLGQVDGYLRQSKVHGEFTSFQSPVDEYHGVPLIDSITELRQLRDGERRVWVITDYKAPVFTSQATRDFLEAEYVKHQEGPILTAYVNAP